MHNTLGRREFKGRLLIAASLSLALSLVPARRGRFGLGFGFGFDAIIINYAIEANEPKKRASERAMKLLESLWADPIRSLHRNE